MNKFLGNLLQRRENGFCYRFVFFIIFLFSIFSISNVSAASSWGDLIKDLQRVLGGGKSITETEIIQGLKEALHIGTRKAVEKVSKTDGYYKDPKIKIPLPEAIQKVEKFLRAAGYGRHVDTFELSMNRAAEEAAPKAKALFWDAIKDMSFSDARKILKGRENEATLYFKDKASDRLHAIFKPIVHEAMSLVGVTRAYQDLDIKIRRMPYASRLSFDLDQYVTDRALDGLFLILAEEETKIRRNPEARVTDLLKKVFGGL